MADRDGNVIRGRFNAAFFDLMEGYMHRKYGERKERMFAELPSEFVELGPGAGANLRYYKNAARLVAVEPNPMMHARLRKNAERHSIDIDIRGSAGERLDLENSSTEAVVTTLVLCTVEDQHKVLSEIHRVLKPGGRFIFLEHVVASEGSLLHGCQRVLQKPWRWIFEGCNLTRQTIPVIEEAGFSSVSIDRFDLHSAFFPVRPHVEGMAIK